MKLIFEKTAPVIEDEDMSTKETILVYEPEEEDELDDFSFLSHAEQLEELCLKENRTPVSDHGKVTRYYIDVSDNFVVVHENKIEY